MKHSQQIQLISRLLMEHWDPIEVKGVPQAANEYDDAARAVVSLLQANVSVAMVAERLLRIEREDMGLQTDGERALRAAEILVKLSV